MENKYFPEGIIISESKNRRYTDSLSGLEEAMEKGIILEGVVTVCDAYHNLHVDLGAFKGIIPKEETVYSPAGEPTKDIAIITRVGKSVCFVVTDILQKDGGTVVMLSRRLAQKMCCENYVSTLSEGDVIDAVVTHIEKFGVFCDIGCGMIGLLPVDCISVSRISHPKERFRCGEKIKCVVKNNERDICRITLTHKELLGTWQENAELFSPGETVAGIVRSIEPYGIFVELTPNLAGLAEWCDGVEEGSLVGAYIKSIIPEKMKIKLIIVGVSSEQANRSNNGYFFEGGHMDEWNYSPEGCTKQVYTQF